MPDPIQIPYSAKDATQSGDVDTTATGLQFTAQRLDKGSYVRYGSTVEVALVGGEATLSLYEDEVYKFVEYGKGGSSAGFYALVPPGATQWSDLIVVTKPGSSQPTADWQANLDVLRGKVNEAEDAADVATAAVAELTEVVGGKADAAALAAVATSGSYNDLANKPAIPSVSGLASETYVGQQINALPAVARSGAYADLSGKPAVPKAATYLRASDLLATLRDFATGQYTLAIASDSTANDTVDWPRVWTRIYTLPSTVRVEYSLWDDATSAYPAATVVQAGSNAAPSGLVMRDTFTRTGSDIVGSTSDNGAVWAGNAGRWTSDGSKISASPVGALVFNAGSRDITMTSTVDLIATSTGVALGCRFYVGAPTSTLANGIWCGLSVSSTGVVSFSLQKTIATVSTSLVGTISAATLGLTSATSTPQSVTVKLQVSIQNLILTITTGTGPHVFTATITEADYATLGTYSGFLTTGAGFIAAKIDDVTMETPPTEEVYNKLAVLNGSVAGTTVAYQQSRLAAMYPGIIDVMIVSTGHNYSNLSASGFTTALASFCDAFVALHPETLMVISSQNPQFLPSGTVVAHKARQAAARVFAKQRGYDYLPAFEAFSAASGGGASLVGSDGIHPTTPPAGTADTGYGATLWAQTWQNVINSRSVL